jgi:hypothetical protein
MAKVRVRHKSEPMEGYVVAIQEKDGRWIYKISHPDQDDLEESWDNWVPEEWLEEVK